LTTIYASSGADWSGVYSSNEMFTGCENLKGGNNTEWSDDYTDAEYARIDSEGKPGYFTEAYARVGGKACADVFSTISAIGGASANDTVEVQLSCWVTAADLGKAATSGTIIYAIANSPAYINLVVPEDANIILGSDCQRMFYQCSKLVSANLRGFNTQIVTDMSYMFSSCSALKTVDVSSFNVQNVTNMNCMFQNSSSLTTIYAAPVTDWSEVPASSTGMFSHNSRLVGGCGSLGVSGGGLIYARIDGLNGQPGYFTRVRLPGELYASVDGVLYDDKASTIAAISSSTADTLKVVIYSGVTGADLGKKATTGSIIATLPNCKGSIRPTLLTVDKDANILLCGDCSAMFSGTAIMEADLRGLNTTGVTNMSSMFAGCTYLTTLNLSSFNTEKVTDMSYMFRLCSSLNTIYVVKGADWSGVETSTAMFSGCSNKLKGGSGTAFNSNKIDAEYAKVDYMDGQPGYFTRVRLPGELYARVDGVLYDDLASTIAAINNSTADTLKVVVYSGVNAKDLGNASKGAEGTTIYSAIPSAKSRKASLIVDKDADILLGADCSGMFSGKSSLVYADLRGLNTRYVTNMSRMFYGCTNLPSLDLSSFNTENVTDMSEMFRSCARLSNIYVEKGADWSGVETSTDMFSACTTLKGGRGTAYDGAIIDATYAKVDGGTENPGYFRAAFEQYAEVNGVKCDNLEATLSAMTNSIADTIDLVLYDGVTAADLGTATTTGTIVFNIRNNITKPIRLVVDKDADIVIDDCYQMFRRCSYLVSADLRGFNTSNVSTMAQMFQDCSGITTLNLSSFDVSNVTDMSYMFGCAKLTTIYVAKGADWSGVATSDCMFQGCSRLKGGNGTAFNSSAIDATRARIDGLNGQPGYFTMVRMPGELYAMVDGTLCDDLASTIAAITNSAADTINLILYSGVTATDLGKGGESGANGIIGAIKNTTEQKVSLVVPEEANIELNADCSLLFYGCSKLVSADLRGLNTENVTDMTQMFQGCGFTTLDLSSFNTSKVTNMLAMFRRCASLTKVIFGGKFTTENVENMSSMFRDDPIDTLDLSSFNTEKVTNMSGMFSGCSALTTLDLSSFSTENVTDMGSMFYGCSKLTTIYAASGANWYKEGVTSTNMFYNCTNLMGGNGTAFNSSAIDATRARIDGLNGQPGYFTSNGVLGGRFSVSAGKQVYFSQGNLQYQASTNTWRFAENQYDYVGSTNANISSTYTGWIDYFGWGTSGYNNKYPYMTSATDSDYGDGENDIAGTEYDWGVHNAISNGGKQAGLWRTLTQEEWAYMLEDESRSGKYGFGVVESVNGLILLPDDWTHPTDISSSSSQTFTSGKSTSSTSWPNTYTAADWAKMQAAGAVFLPAAGYRAGTSIRQVSSMGDYWLATANGSSKAYRLYFTPTDIDGASASNRNYGFSVRLVRDK
ncbi:MAG: BspA family leucine-rich repeat surface protein, partial [Salinivirgaceae bacterium]|nr:BspA family leucine-rich repeat surface protein [Salinivirgaceae bacterium]